MAGKADWLAMGMPTEGTAANVTIKNIVREVPVCGLKDELATAKSRISGEWNICIVIDPKRIVLGLLESSMIQDYEGPIEDIMKPAPITFRPSVLIDDAVHHFHESNLTFVLITKSTGELMGGIRRIDVEAANDSGSAPIGITKSSDS